MFIRYLRRADRTPFGAVVGLQTGGIGVSVCRKTDTYDKVFGRQLAIGRAVEHDATTGTLYNGPTFQGGRVRDEIIQATEQIRTQQRRSSGPRESVTTDALASVLRDIAIPTVPQ